MSKIHKNDATLTKEQLRRIIYKTYWRDLLEANDYFTAVHYQIWHLQYKFGRIFSSFSELLTVLVWPI